MEYFGELDRGMQVFGEFVALRSHEHRSYLHAGEDGRSVYHRGAVSDALPHNAVWAVQGHLVAAAAAAAGLPPTRYVLLRGAYGRYLGGPDATDHHRPPPEPVRATQRDRDEEEVDALMWLASAGESENPDGLALFLLQDRSGRYLRACSNKGFPRRRGGAVSVDANINDGAGASLRWEVVPVPPAEILGQPELPIATESDFREQLNTCCSRPMLREIQFVMAADADDTSFIGDGDWDSLQHRGRSVQILREKLVEAVQDDFTMCVRAGRHGRLTPLLVNLPRSRETLRVVLVRPNSAAAAQLIFPNPNALTASAAIEELRVEEDLVELGDKKAVVSTIHQAVSEAVVAARALKNAQGARAAKEASELWGRKNQNHSANVFSPSSAKKQQQTPHGKKMMKYVVEDRYLTGLQETDDKYRRLVELYNHMIFLGDTKEGTLSLEDSKDLKREMKSTMDQIKKIRHFIKAMGGTSPRIHHSSVFRDF
uniref:DUF569 domain-containing protein n=1 Tax=Leersia perrieri TaxID=77586 RepID=A0A0D9XU48_9ORYZ